MGIFSNLTSRLGRRPLLGDLLVKKGLVTREQVNKALEHQERKGFRIGYHLIKLGMIDEHSLGQFLSEHFHVPLLDDKSLHLRSDIFKGIANITLLEHEVFPLNRAGNTLTLVMADPSDTATIDQLSKTLGLVVNPVVAPQSVVRKHLAHYFALSEIQKELGTGKETNDVTQFFTHLKDYRFESVLGVGGFGMVCKCWQVSLDRSVAVKTMSQKLTEIPGMTDRFKREGKIIAKLNHPNIIQVFEQGESHDLLYIVMQYFKGKTLDVFCEGKDLVEKIGCLIPMCDALQYACGQGVVHRDLKPGNILANDKGEVKLLDFGISYVQQATNKPRFTMQNVVLGTPKYMAPECFDTTVEIDTQADIFAMGVIAYELLTGEKCTAPPIKAPHQINSHIPVLLSKTILKALEGEKSKRLSNFDLFKRALAHSRDQVLMGRTVFVSQAPSSDLAAMQSPGRSLDPKGAPTAGRATISTNTMGPPLVAVNQQDALRQCYEDSRSLRDEDGVSVMLAKHRQMNRKVVIKCVPVKDVHYEMIERLADIKHPNIGQVLGVDVEGDKVVLVMEYIESGSLNDRMQGGPTSPENFVVWCNDMVEALKIARQRGVSHGRLHPGNILFTSENQLKIVDFGSQGLSSSQFARFSRPEIHDAWEQDRYGLGVIWFEMLMGERFRGAISFEKNFKKVQANSAIEPLMKVPLGRLWNIQRYGRKYEVYSDMIEDLRFIREKISPSTTLGPRKQASKRASSPWWAFWK